MHLQSTSSVERARWSRAVRLIALSALVGTASTASTAEAATSGANGTHDPSRMVESEGRFYVYSTGGGSKSSPDGLVWTGGPGIFAGTGIPSSATSVTTTNQGVWAPDVIYYNGLYFLFYSIASSASACATGLITSPTLNPTSPNYKWTDRGVVASNNTSATYCAIDPAPFIDAENNLWVAWGSGYSHSADADSIWVTRLNNMTGAFADTAKPGHPVQKGHIEGSYVHYHDKFYYLFWNSGGCCDGPSSNYLIHVARAQSVTGPYTGARNFYGTTGSIHGPGHMGIYDKCGASRFTYHYFPDSGGSVLGENELTWGADGWPVVGPPSTVPLVPCGPGAGDGGVPPVSDPAKDAGVSDGTGGRDAPAERGGEGNLGGEAGAGGDPLSGGSGGGSGSAGGAGRADNTASGGTSGSAGARVAGGTGVTASPSPESGPPADPGCACRLNVGAPSERSTLPTLALLGVALGWARRRERRRHA